jgi:hypothetical protein
MVRSVPKYQQDTILPTLASEHSRDAASRRADEMSNRKLGGKFYNYFKQTRKDQQESYLSPKKEETI